MLQSFSLYLLLATVIRATPNDALSTSITAQETCITRYGHAPYHPGSVRTSTRTKHKTVSTTTKIESQPSTTTRIITPSAITLTTEVSPVDPVTSTSVVYETITASAACSSTGPSQSPATTIVYTGTYSPPAATSAPLTPRSNNHHILLNIFGRAALNSPTRKPIRVDCLKKETTYLISTTACPPQITTKTITAETPTYYRTQSQSLPTTTITSTSTLIRPCTTPPSASPTATTTQHIKCAPTNLISSINGQGIGGTQSEDTSDQGLAPGSDPSACCQLCLDTENCAASADDVSAGNCFLFYTEPVCGTGFNYFGSANLAPGEGFLVQSGCGRIIAGPVME